MTAIHKSNIYITIALNPTTTRHQPRNPKTAKAENRSSSELSSGETKVQLWRISGHFGGNFERRSLFGISRILKIC